MPFTKNILSIGAGYVGGPTMAVMADNCRQCAVNVVDIDADRIAAWNSGEPPFYEPGLKEVLQRALNRNLTFSTDVAAGIRDADIIFVSINTPTKTFGDGAGMAADLQYWEATARQIREHAGGDKIVVEKSTLPVRTAASMAGILNPKGGQIRFEIVSNPEFLAEGTAIRDLQRPDRVLIGGHQTGSGRNAVQEIVDIYANWVDPERILTTNVWSSELTKLAANAFLAQRISSINSIANICEATEADIDEVAKGIGMDSRIGPDYLRCSVGFGGSCFEKDILNMVYMCRYYGLDDVADFWHKVVTINSYQKDRFVRRMITAMFSSVVNKRIAVLGFAFKADTGDTRASPAIDVCRQLLEERAVVVVTDPQALPGARADLASFDGCVEYEEDPYTAAAGSHALAILTDWPEYRDLDYKRIYEAMEKPAFVFDGRNLLDHRTLHALGFNVYGIGKATLIH